MLRTVPSVQRLADLADGFAPRRDPRGQPWPEPVRLVVVGAPFDAGVPSRRRELGRAPRPPGQQLIEPASSSVRLPGRPVPVGFAGAGVLPGHVERLAQRGDVPIEVGYLPVLAVRVGVLEALDALTGAGQVGANVREPPRRDGHRLLSLGVLGAGVLDAAGSVAGGPAARGDLIRLQPRVRAQVRGVDGQERPDAFIGGDEGIQAPLDGLQRIEATRRLPDERLVERAQPVAQRLGQLGRVQPLRELGPPQRQQQGEQLLEAFGAEPEQGPVHGRAVLAGLVGHRVLAELRRQLRAGERPVVGTDERELHTHPSGHDEEPRVDLLVVLLRTQADADRDRVGDRARARVATGELHPCVAVRRGLPAPQQVRLHRARLGGERVEAAGVDPAVQHEGVDQFEHLRLAGAVVTAQHEAPVAEAELLVDEVPDVDDTAADRLPPAHGPQVGRERGGGDGGGHELSPESNRLVCRARTDTTALR